MKIDMSVPSVAVFLVLSGLVAATVLVIRHIFATARSMYRLDLWKLRDDVVDALCEGRVRSTRPAVALLNVVEHAIISADEFTAGRVIATYLGNRSLPTDTFLHDGVPDVAELKAFQDELTAIRIRWWRKTSLLGALDFLWFTPAFLVWRATTGRKVSAPVPERDAVVSRRVDTSGAPAMKLMRVDPSELAHCI